MKKVISCIVYLVLFPLLVYAATYNGTATGPELDYVHGVTSPIQTQISSVLATKQDTITSSTDLTVKSLTVAKQKGLAGINARYEAYSTNTKYVGEIGPASMSANQSYLLRDPAARATSANQVKACTNSGETGTGTSADPYIQACAWADLDDYAPAFTSGTANYFWATPNGSSGVPSLRAIVGADLPAATTSVAGSMSAADKLKLDGMQNAEYDNGTCTTSATISAANGDRQKITLTNGQTCLLSFTQPASGTKVIGLTIIQSATSSYNGLINTSGVYWLGGAIPTMAATSGSRNHISCFLNGTITTCGSGGVASIP